MHVLQSTREVCAPFADVCAFLAVFAPRLRLTPATVGRLEGGLLYMWLPRHVGRLLRPTLERPALRD